MIKQQALDAYFQLQSLANSNLFKQTEVHNLRQAAWSLVQFYHISEAEIMSGKADVNPSGQAGIGWELGSQPDKKGRWDQ
jgi:hypothetical protein